MEEYRFTDHIRITPGQEKRLSALALKVLSFRDIPFVIQPETIYRNGDIQLLYDIQDAESLPDGLLTLKGWEREQAAKRIIANFFSLVEAIEQDSFLHDTYIQVRPELVFTNISTGEGMFILVPDTDYHDGAYELIWLDGAVRLLSRLLEGSEDESLKSMFKRISDAGVVDGAERGTNRYRYRELLLNLMLDAKEPSFQEQVRERSHTTEVELRHEGSYGKVAFFIRNDEFIIGKDAQADGVISGNSAISRRHCAVRRRNNIWTVSDLGSTNYTYLDGKRIMDEEEALLRSGMELRIADMPFEITIRNI